MTDQKEETTLNVFKPIIPALLLASSVAGAEPPSHIREEQKTLNIIADIIVVRPISLIGTLAGTALFAAFSPFAAFASFAPPHDAFARTADAFIGAPACYTFNRPLGSPFSGQDASNQSYCDW